MAVPAKVLMRNLLSVRKSALPLSKQLLRLFRHPRVFTKNQYLLHHIWKVSLSFIIPTMSAVAVTNPEIKKLLDESDDLYNKKEFAATYDLLVPHKDSNDGEILWRLARAATDKGKMFQGDERKKLIYEAWDYIKKALEQDPNNFACHKWYGILLDYTGEYEGTKQRIANAFKVKEHFLKAIELNPKDGTSKYCLGYWCFLFADMPWYQRKVAGVLFASPPTATYEEALEHFKSAEEATPGFYNKNIVMLGKTYLRLKDKETAKKYLLKALEHQDKTTDDAEARKEAIELLKELGVKV